MKYFLTLLALSLPFCGHRQQLDTKISSDTSSVRIFENPALNLLTASLNPSPQTIKTRGYRIQIYNGIDRAKAKNIQLTFMQHHLGISAYIIYNQPNFRVRVGDYLNRQKAYKLYNELREKYSCIIVPTIINVRQ